MYAQESIPEVSSLTPEGRRALMNLDLDTRQALVENIQVLDQVQVGLLIAFMGMGFCALIPVPVAIYYQVKYNAYKRLRATPIIADIEYHLTHVTEVDIHTLRRESPLVRDVDRFLRGAKTLKWTVLGLWAVPALILIITIPLVILVVFAELAAGSGY